MRVDLRLLGRFAASVGDPPGRVLAIPARRRRAVLAYLALQPERAETRERLATLLWGDSPDKQARQSLRQCLATLRKELESDAPDLLVVERDVVGLKPGLVEIDVQVFESCAASPDVADLDRALALWRGPFLDGLDLEADGFSTWLRAQRARLDCTAARAFETLAELRDRSGHGAEAIAAAERLVGLDPLREHGQRLLLRLYARHRGRDAALVRGEQAVGILRRELAVEPEPETLALLASIRRGDIAVARVASGSTPAAIPGNEVEAARDAGPGTPVPPIAVTGETLSAAADSSRPAATAIPPAIPRFAGRSAFMRHARWSVAGLAILAAPAALAMSGWLSPRPAPPAQGAGTAERDAAWRSPGIQPGAGADARRTAGISAVVVLPFTTDAGQPGPEAVLAGRITEDLINDLSRAPGLRVISRATSRLYQGRTVDVAAVGQELDVRYAVEGSVRLHGDTLRVNAALIDTRSRLQVWSDRIERDRADRIAIQDEIVRGITRQLQVNVLIEEDRRRLPGAASGETQVDDLLAKGWAAMLRISTMGTTSGADGYFQEALRRDPDNVSGLVGLGAYHVTVVAMFLVQDPGAHLTAADDLLGRAIRRNPRHSLAHYFQGILHKVRSQPQAALASFGRSLEINPSFAPAHAQVGHVLSRTGRLTDAMEHVRYAIRLSPRDPNLGLWSTFGGQIQLELGNDAAAIEWFSRAVAIDPRSPFNHVNLAAAYALTGDTGGAARHAAEVRRLAPWLTPKVMVERLVGTSDGDSQPRRLLQGLRLAFPSPA